MTKEVDVVRAIVDGAGLDPSTLEDITKSPDFLPINPTPKEPSVREFEEDPCKSDLQNDYQKVRQTLGQVLLQAHGAMDDLVKLATESEHARVYEVLSQFVKVIAESGEKLINIHKMVEEIEEPPAPSSQNVTNNNLFVGTAADLQSVLNKLHGGRGMQARVEEEDQF